MASLRGLTFLLLLTAALAGCSDDAGGDGGEGGNGGGNGGTGSGEGGEGSGSGGEGEGGGAAPGEPFSLSCSAVAGAGAMGNGFSLPLPPVGIVDPVAWVGGCSMGEVPGEVKVEAITVSDGCASYYDENQDDQFTDGEAAVGSKYDAGTIFGMYCDAGAVQPEGTISFIPQ